MASTKIFVIIIAVFAIFLPSILATEFVVGDGKGWVTNFDYQTWAQEKEFRVGDSLVFKYNQAFHDVLRVNQTAFQQCLTSPSGVVPLATGNDAITLATTGTKWYICSKADHCASKSMKLSITVLPKLGSAAPSPSPAAVSPTSAAPGGPATMYYWNGHVLEFFECILFVLCLYLNILLAFANI